MPDHAEIEALLARTALRDRGAFGQLYAATSAKLFAVVLRILGNRAEAEEALQETYMKIWHRADRFRPEAGTPMVWLVAIARNHAIDVIRARKPAAGGLDLAERVADPAPSPEAAAVGAGEMAQIERCMALLRPDRAEAVRSAYVEGRSYEELAGKFAVPLNTMRTWLRRSLLQLRECLER